MQLRGSPAGRRYKEKVRAKKNKRRELGNILTIS
jgi:hypothetical protein